MVEVWLPIATTVWARESVGNLSALRVTVTGEGIQSPIISEKQIVNPVSGDVVTFDLTVPAGADRRVAGSGPVRFPPHVRADRAGRLPCEWRRSVVLR